MTSAPPVILTVGPRYAVIKLDAVSRHGGKREGSGRKRRTNWAKALAGERPHLGTPVKVLKLDGAVRGSRFWTGHDSEGNREWKERTEAVDTTTCKVGAPWGSDDPTGPCTRTGRVHTWHCAACNARHWTDDPCTRLDCARCARKGGRVAKRRARRLVARLGGVPWGIWTVTFPRAWQDRLTFDALEKFATAVRSALQACYLSWFGARIGLREYWHPEGDKRPGHPLWHWNAIVPLRGINAAGAPVDLRFALKPWQLAEFRSRVASILADIAPALGERPPTTEQGEGDSPPEDGARPAAVVWYGFRVENARKLHAGRYFGRPFAWWGVALGRLHHGRDYGLLSIGAFRSLGQDAWRAFRESLRSAEQADGGLSCRDCGGELVHDTMRWTHDAWMRDYMVAASHAGEPP